MASFTEDPISVSVSFLSLGRGGPVDAVAPTATFTTVGGRLASKSAPVVVSVADDTGISVVTVLVYYPGLNVTECAYHNGSFRAPYLESTFASGSFTLRRDTGWAQDFSVEATVVDTAGNVSA